MLPLRNPESAQVDVVALTLSALGFKRKTMEDAQMLSTHWCASILISTSHFLV